MEQFYWGQPGICDEVYKNLSLGRVVLATTDTIPGFLTMCNDAGRDALDRIKSRSDKPYLVLAATVHDALALMRFDSIEQQNTVNVIIKNCWPGPLTLICFASEAVPLCAQSSDGSVGIRVPDHAFLRELLQKTGPLFSTSANISGVKAPVHMHEVEKSIVDQMAMIVCEDSEKSHNTAGLSSTIIDCRLNPVQIIREGACSFKKISALVPIKRSSL